ncbi:MULTISPECIES: EexN family lipoprotein [unclassified Bartonella]|uniref:EexN family lipoprotein n=1 Tax=unclassified Bartonella TaxID=2645622 RepID=UPI0035CEB9B1
MKKIILLCMALLFVVGCEKTYSVEDFKKDAKLREEWGKKCFLSGLAVQESKNCQNVLQADNELFFSPKLDSTGREHGF